jgi:hypothetical protein
MACTAGEDHLAVQAVAHLPLPTQGRLDVSTSGPALGGRRGVGWGHLPVLCNPWRAPQPGGGIAPITKRLVT